MATNLLLEGDDLEALLIKAHSEGGPTARIVRADKYRHGGLWGFFARERFEVAVEIPEIPRGALDGSAFFVPSATDAAGATRSAAPDGPDLVTARAATIGPSAARIAAAERLVDHLEDYLAEQPTLLPSRPEPSQRPAPTSIQAAPIEAAPIQAAPIQADPIQTDSIQAARVEAVEPPAPAAFAADALLGLVDRVSAAERAATRTVRARYASTDLQPRTEIDLPAAEPEPADRPAELVGVGLSGAAAHQAPRMASGWPGSPSPGGSTSATGDLPANGTVTTDMNVQRPANAAEAPPATARPSTTRPEFTALLDTLRDGARPGRSARPAAPVPPSDAATTTATTARGADDPAVTAPLDLCVDSRAAGAPTAAIHPVRIPAQGGPLPSELDEEDVPEVGLRQSDPRTAADRRTLRALGVPAAWTRRLRPGDRFAEVMRVLERMPEEDIDPSTTIVAVVGGAESVRLEAHRTALDLAVDGEPRPVVVVPATVGTDRAAAVARALRSGPVVLAVETDGDDASLVLDTLTTVQAGAVIAVVDATTPLEHTQRWLDALGQVDALVLDGAAQVADPATVLQLGLPVVRLDGIPVDRVTWTAVLCAQIVAAEQAAAGEY